MTTSTAANSTAPADTPDAGTEPTPGVTSARTVHPDAAAAAAVRPAGPARADRQCGDRDRRHDVRAGLPVGHPAGHRRTGCRAGHFGAVAAGRPAAGARRRRGRAVLGAAHAVRPADDAGRGDHAGRDLRPPAEAAGGVPRPLAGRATDVPGGVRPGDHPPVPRVRPGVPDRQSDHLRRRGGHPADAVLAARADHRGAGHSAGGAVLPVRGQVPGAGPALPGSGRRSRHHGRGIGARHPDPQGLRPQRAPQPAIPGAGHANCGPPRSARPG